MIESIGKYKILYEAGHGGMARVFLAEDTQLKRKVALKLLHEHLSNDADYLKRFKREAITMAQLKHQNIVNVYEYQETESYYFIVNEFVEGYSLKEFITKHPLKYPPIGLMIMYEVCSAISYAHKNGIVHRDIKPDNIMISNIGEIKVMDFGIAQISSETTITMEGSVLGSPAYMSPEQALGNEIDERSDIFSLGTLLYQLLTNQIPFFGNNTTAIIQKVIQAKYELPMKFNGLIDKEINYLIEKTLNSNKSLRFQTTEELKIHIETILKKDGFENFSEELECFFKNPEDYEKKIHLRLIDVYKKNAFLSYKKRNIIKAIKYCNKVFELDSNNPEMKKLVKKLKIIQTNNKIWLIFLFIIIILTIFIYSLKELLKIDNDSVYFKKSYVNKIYSNCTNYVKELLKPSIQDYLYLSQFNFDLNSIKDDEKKLLPENMDKISEKLNTFVKKEDTKSIIENNNDIIDNTKKTEEIKETDTVAIKKFIEIPVNETKTEQGEVIYCFKPYATIYIDEIKQDNDCLINPIKINFGEHILKAVYPYSGNFIKKFNLNSQNKKIEIRHNFLKYIKLNFKFKSNSIVMFSLKSLQNEYVVGIDSNKKETEIKDLNLSTGDFLIMPGNYLIELSDGDVKHQINVDFNKKGTYNIYMDIQNEETITINHN